MPLGEAQRASAGMLVAPGEEDVVVVLVAAVGVAVDVVVVVPPLGAVDVLVVIPDVPLDVLLVEPVPAVVAPPTLEVVDVLVVADVVESVPPREVVAAEVWLTDIVTDLVVAPELPLQVILMVMFPYNGCVERLPDVATKFVRLPLVAMHDVAEVADHVTSDVPPLLTDSGLAVSWICGAASARGSIIRSVIA